MWQKIAIPVLVIFALAPAAAVAQHPDAPLPSVGEFNTPLPRVSDEVLAENLNEIGRLRDLYVESVKREHRALDAYESFGKGSGPYNEQIRQTYEQATKAVHAAREILRVKVVVDLRQRIQHTTDRKSAALLIKPRLDTAAANVSRLRKELPETLATMYPSFWSGTVSQREESEALARAYLEAYHWEHSAIAEFYGNQRGIVTVRATDLGLPDRSQYVSEIDYVETNWIVSHLASLSQRLVGIRPEINPDDSVPDRVHEFLAEAERRVLLDQYKRLAFNALILNVATHQPLEGKARQKLGFGMMENLADRLMSADDDPSDLERLINFFGVPMDSRDEFAEYVAAGIPSRNYEYRITALAGGVSEPSPTEYFLVLAHVLAEESYKDILKYRDEYLGADDTLWNRNLETYLRTNGYPLSVAQLLMGDSRRDEVDKRLADYIESGQKLADVFRRAAETRGDPAKLARDDLRLLEDFGYVIRYQSADGDGEQLVYHIPQSNRGLGAHFNTARKNLALPEASFLSAVSPREIALIVAAWAVPEYGAALVASELRAIGASALMQAVGRFTVNAVLAAYVDMSVDAAEYYLSDEPKSERFDASVFNKYLMEALILDSVNDVVGKLGSKVLASVIREYAWASESPRMRAFLARAIQEEPSTAKSIYDFTQGVLSIGQNTAVQYAYQSLVEDQQLDSRQIMMMAFRAALTKAIERSGEAVGDYLKRDEVPRFYRDALDADPQLRAETIRNLEAAIERKRRLIERFERVVEERGDSAESRFSENMKGEFTWEETKALHAEGLISAEIQAEIAKLRLDHFNKMIHEARKRAIAEVHARYEVFLRRAQDSAENTAAAEALARRRRDREIALINAELKAPGSDSPISDIDRSTGSVYLRKHLVGMWEAGQRARDGGETTTSARAFDVNEYINVFVFIKNNRAYVEALKSQTTGPVRRIGQDELVPDADFGELTLAHDEAMTAIALSGAMRDMDANQRHLYTENLRRSIVDDLVRDASRSENVRQMPYAQRVEYQENLRRQILAGGDLAEPVRRFDERVDWATGHLADSEAELARVAEQIRGDRPADDPDVLLEAKDDLYQQRMEEVNDLQFELSVIEQDGNSRTADALKLRGLVERKMAIAMRDGIQTYTHTVGLDVIVNRVQDKKKLVTGEDGTVEERAYSVADRLDDDSFVLTPDNEELKMYSREDIRGIIHDQVMFIVEHVNHFNAGAEEAAATGRAIGKYVERYFLAQKILGLDIKKIRSLPDSNATRRLLEISQEIVRNKANPAEVLRILARVGRRSPGTPRSGIAELFFLIERTIPGMEGMTGLRNTSAPSAGGAASATDTIKYEIGGKFMAGFVAKALFDFRQQLQVVASLGGQRGAVRLIDDRTASIAAELQHLEEQVAEMVELARKYRSRNWEMIYRFAPEVGYWKTLEVNLPWQNAKSATLAEYRRGRGLAEQRMKNLNSSRGSISAVEARRILADDPGTPEYRWLMNRIEFLERLRAALEKDRLAAETKGRSEDAFAAIRLTGTWTCVDSTRSIGELKIVHDEPQVLNMTLGYRDRGDAESIFNADASYRFGKIQGIFRDQSQPVDPIYANSPSTFRSVLFEASTNRAGNKIQFSNDIPQYDGVDVVWSAVVCTPKREDEPAPEFISSTTGPLPEIHRDNALADRAGYLVVESLSPDGERVNLPHFVRRGTQRFAGPWLPAGSYQVSITLNNTRFPADVTLAEGSMTRATVRAGGLIWRHSGPFKHGSKPEAEIWSAASPDQMVFQGAGQPRGDGQYVLLAPGLYNMSFRFSGGMLLEELEVVPGKWTTVDVAWSGLELTSGNGQAFIVGSIQRRSETAADQLQTVTSAAVRTSPRAAHSISLPPGNYVINIIRGSESLSRDVSLTAGATTAVSF